MSRKLKIKDRRLNRKRTFGQEFFVVFLIVYVSTVGFTMLYNRLIVSDKGIVEISLAIILYLLFMCFLASSAIFFWQSKYFTKRLQSICDAAKKVASGDFSVKLEQRQDEGKKNEIGILIDDFNTMVAELSSIESMKNDFISDVSHEIKTPLSAIQGYSDLLKNPELPKEKRLEYAAEISAATSKMTSLVSNILKLNKIENQEIMQTKRFSLDEQLRCCMLSYEDMFEKNNIEISAELEELNITSDENLLEIVWNNLLGNALKYTEPGGNVNVTLKKDGSSARVTVSDTGCGISEETQKHIFDKFYQGDTSHSEEGNGLGLSLVKQVLDRVNGKIDVKSVPGEGSDFTVTLKI